MELYKCGKRSTSAKRKSEQPSGEYDKSKQHLDPIKFNTDINSIFTECIGRFVVRLQMFDFDEKRESPYPSTDIRIDIDE